MMKKWTFFLLIFTLLYSAYATDLTILHNSLDRNSIVQLFSFYYLYPDTPQGKKALSDAWRLIRLHRTDQGFFEQDLFLPETDIDSIIAIINKQPFESTLVLNNKQLSLIENISSHLSNRKLKGFSIWDKNACITLPSEEIDLSRALLLDQFENDSFQVRQYEAMIDLMALQILARLPIDASHEEKIYAINHFIFHEKGFRFPPYALVHKEGDLYTLLPSVLDSRLGVCLGVSILYLSIAQRLDLPLKIITPIGHIFVRYEEGNKVINIETTKRGVHLPDRFYLDINTYKLQERTLKEVVALTFMNQAATSWQKKDHETAVMFYEKALLYMPNDPLVKLFLAYNYLLCDRIEEGKQVLEKLRDITFDHVISKETVPTDFLEGRVDAQGIQLLFTSPADNTRQSIVEKQKKLQKSVEQFPLFREGIFQLAVTYLQLHNTPIKKSSPSVIAGASPT